MLCKKLLLHSLQAVRLKEKGIASEIIAVSCGPAKSEVIIALYLLKNDMKFIGGPKKKIMWCQLFKAWITLSIGLIAIDKFYQNLLHFPVNVDYYMLRA